MYSEDYEERSRRKEFPFRDFLLKLILIIIFVLLLVWLIPWPNNSVLTDRIFNANIQEMKDASLLYFTAERLPANVGDKKTVTLREMLDLKLLLPFTDKNGKSCDIDNSYVTIEKLEDEYLLKVYLKCDDEEDYILVHVGCYAYCTTEVCEKQEEPKSTNTPSQTNQPRPTANPKPNNTPQPTKSPNPTNSPTPTNTPTPSTNSQPYCTLTVTDGVLNSDGTYNGNVSIGWASKGSTNGATITGFGLGGAVNYKGANTFVVTNNGKTTVYGYVRDSKGKTASCSITVTKKTETVQPTQEYEYQYKKNIGKQYSAWTAWSKDTVYVDADNIPFGNYELAQLENLGTRQELIGYKNYKITYHKTKPVQVGSYEKVMCTGYQYVEYENVTYAVTSGWTKTNEVYSGTVAPADSVNTQWRYESVDQSTCLPSCTDHTVMNWRKYTRTTTSVPSTSTGSGVLSCSQTSSQTIPLYGLEHTYETVTAKVDVYADVKYYRYRTRTVVKEAYTDYKWSSSQNDTGLTSQGYTYTGVKRVKEQ